MLFMLISFGHTASHSPSLLQLPKPSSSICSTIACPRRAWILAVHRRNVVHADFFRAHSLAFAFVAAVAEALLVHLQHHRLHAPRVDTRGSSSQCCSC